MPDNAECNCKDLSVDHESWEIILDPAFCNDPGAADALAHLLFILKEAIESGRDNSKAISILTYGLEQVYLYTDEHKMARDLYMLYLTGNLKPWDEPTQLIKGAIGRFRAESKSQNSSRKGKRAQKRRQSAGGKVR